MYDLQIFSPIWGCLYTLIVYNAQILKFFHEVQFV